MNKENGLKVFKVGDSEWYASPLGVEDFICWFRYNIDNSDSYEELLEEVEECDLDKDCMWCPSSGKEDIKELGDSDESSSEGGIGDLRRSHEDDKSVEKLTSFREVIRLKETPKEPFCIATTNY